MPQSPTTLDLDVPQELGFGPPRPRRSRKRQLFMLLLLLLLVTIIFAYWIVTDPNRVQPMAEHYLSKVVGGRVKIDKAHLSIFEGLRLDGVKVYVGDERRPDSELFSARTLLVRANLIALLRGQLESTQIVALDPRVRLCENLDTTDEYARWNYMLRKQPPPEKQPGSIQPMAFPEIVLRGGMVEYSRIMNGHYEPMGSMAIDGQLTPDRRPAHPNAYIFELDSRGAGEAAGPRVGGHFQTDRPLVMASLQNFEFNQALRAMLPSQVQAWWEAHQLAGRIHIPRFQLIPGKPGTPLDFHIEVQLDGVNLAVLPEELLGTEEYRSLSAMRPCLRIATMPQIGYASRSDLLERYTQLRPLSLSHVSGRLVFTPDQIRIAGLSGKLENNPVHLDGAIYGYNENAPASLRLIANNLQIPTHPRYIASMPQVVRKIYSDFTPSGRASLFFELRREKPGAKLRMTGKVSVLDGAFCFDEFPYPLRGITGTITLGPDRATGQDRIDLIKLRCIGTEGRNANSSIVVNGYVSPIDRAAVEVRVTGQEVWLEPSLRRALPPDARAVIDMFDLRQRGAEDHPPVIAPMELRGAFEARVHRKPGPRQKVWVEVDLDIAHGRGEFSGFPYPLRNVTGHIHVRPRQTTIDNLVSRNGNSSIRIDGEVNYGPGQPAAPKLKVTATNVPLDDDLFTSLGKQQRQWLQKGGVSSGLIRQRQNFPSPQCHRFRPHRFQSRC